MTNSRDRLLAILLCLNVVLLTFVVASNIPGPQAYAQVTGANSEYILIPGQISQSKQIVWVIKSSSSLLSNCVYDNNRRSIEFGDIIDMNIDLSIQDFFDEESELLPGQAPTNEKNNRSDRARP